MSNSMKVAIAVIVLLAAAMTGYYFSQKKTATASFAPERPEQATLAAEHVECAAFYSQPDAKLGNNPNRVGFLKFHTETGLNFSEDKQKFNSDVTAATGKMAEQLAAAEKGGTQAKFVEDKNGACVKLMGKSSDFIADVMKSRKAK